MTAGRFEKALFLSLGQIIGLSFAVLSPMLLSRWLTVEDFGTYRQLLLLIWFASMTLHLGMDFGLFYFIKRGGGQASMFSLNASLVGAISAFVFGSGLVIFSEGVGAALNNPELSPLLPYLAVAIFFIVPSQHLENLLVVMDKPKWVVAHAAFNAFAQAMITIGLLWSTQDLRYVVAGIAVYYAVKSATLITLNVRRVDWQSFAVVQWWADLKTQLAHCLPLGLSGMLAMILQMDRFLIATMFPVRQFTKYAVGCFELPIIPGLINNIHDLMSIDMVRKAEAGDHAGVRGVWKESVQKIALLIVPVFLVTVIFAEEIITFIFSMKYIESAVYFRVFMISVLLYAFDPELVLRAYGKSKQTLRLQIGDTVVTVALMLSGIFIAGPIGALWGKAAANLIVLVYRLKVCAQLMDATLRDVTPVGLLCRTFLAAGAGSSLAYLLVLPLPDPWRGVSGIPLAVGLMVVALWRANVFSAADKARFKLRLRSVLNHRPVIITKMEDVLL